MGCLMRLALRITEMLFLAGRKEQIEFLSHGLVLPPAKQGDSHSKEYLRLSLLQKQRQTMEAPGSLIHHQFSDLLRHRICSDISFTLTHTIIICMWVLRARGASVEIKVKEARRTP